MKEIWKGVIYQNEDYSERLEVSNIGKLRNAITKHVYKLHLNKTGYLQACISLGSRDNKKIFKVHKAVAETFVDNLDSKPEVNHKDGVKTNNNDWNLEWMTGKENVNHAIETGLKVSVKGEDVWNSKLTNDSIVWILENYILGSQKFGTRAIGRIFNMNHKTIEKIVKNETWKHVDRSKINNKYIKK